MNEVDFVMIHLGPAGSTYLPKEMAKLISCDGSGLCPYCTVDEAVFRLSAISVNALRKGIATYDR